MDKNQIYGILNQVYFSEEPYEKEVLEHLPEILRSVKIFVDVGASLGQYTFHANKHIRGGHIFAIEADPIRFDELKNNCRKWQALSNNKLQAVHTAASDKDGQAKFYITNSPVSGGLFKYDTSRTRQDVEWEEVSVKSFKLDTVFKDGTPDFVKIDVEGSELRVLRGCTKILEEGKAKFLVEIHNRVDPEGQKNTTEVFNVMKSFGYHSINFYGRHLFVQKIPPELLFLWCRTQMKKLLKWIVRRTFKKR